MIEQSIYSHLASLPDLVDERVYPMIAPQNATYPYILYMIVADEEWHDLLGSTGCSRARVQLEVWSDSYLEARQVSNKLRLYIDGYAGYWGETKIQACLKESSHDDFTRDVEAQVNTEYICYSDYSVIYEKDTAYTRS